MIPSTQAWFAGGERVGYDPKTRAMVATEDAPLRIFMGREGFASLATAVGHVVNLCATHAIEIIRNRELPVESEPST